MVYLVSYDLNEPCKDYSALIRAIETYNANGEHFCKVLKSQWFIYSNKTAEQIFVHLRRFIDDDDELFVCELNANCFGKFNELRPVKWVDNLRRA